MNVTYRVKIVTPNGRVVLFDKNGVLETGIVSNVIDDKSFNINE